MDHSRRIREGRRRENVKLVLLWQAVKMDTPHERLNVSVSYLLLRQ